MVRSNAKVGERCKCSKVQGVSQDGALTSENDGMSSVKACENHAHRKSKVSYARFIRVGLVGPKLYPEGEGDG